MTKLKGPKIWVELNTNEIYPKDPGMGTPVLICLSSGETATWNCGTSEGEIDGEPLTDEQSDWLKEITPKVEAWMLANGV